MTNKERPILFKGPMVRAILEGRKTQTRRIIDKKWMPIVEECLRVNGKWVFDTLDFELTTPKGKPGDLLWVRENHSIFHTHGQHRDDDVRWGPWGGLPTVISPDRKQIAYFEEGFDRCDPGRWRPSIHMPRWACRLFLEVTGVKVERLQDITENDAMCEGADFACVGCGEIFCVDKNAMGLCWKPECGAEDFSFIAGFKILWDTIAKPGFQWTDNPWVWVIEFKRIDA